MPRVQRSIVIDCTPEQLLSIVCDYEKYPEFLTEVKAAKVLRSQGDATEVQHEIEVIRRIRYTLRHVVQGTNMRWTLVKGDLLKKNDGGWELESAGEGRTKATYWLDVAFGGLIPVPTSITDALSANSLPKVLESFKKRAEKLFPKNI